MTRRCFGPDDVSEEDTWKVLEFLNVAATAEEIAQAVEIPGERDVGITVAQHLLDRRGELGVFTSLQQVAGVEQVGPERFSEIVATLSSIDIPDKLRSTTSNDLEDMIERLEQKLISAGEDAQLANIDLQNALQKQQQTLQMMSNVSKMLHDTAMAIIRKVG